MYKSIFYFFFLFVFVARSQQLNVLDADTGNAISNVAVYNSDKSKVALTDFDGHLEISIFSNNERIIFKHISYEVLKTSKSQILKQGNKVFLFMKPEQLDEVVMSVSKWEQQKKDCILAVFTESEKTFLMNMGHYLYQITISLWLSSFLLPGCGP